MLRWPAEDGQRQRLSLSGEPRLLLVDEGEPPPSVLDCLEDWIRMPAPDSDVQARVDGLGLRNQAHEQDRPGLDRHGVLRYRDGWVALPALEARLADQLIGRFGAVVGRDVLHRAGWPGGEPSRNALDVHVLRLRRRLAPVGLVIRTVRSRGYLLEAAPPPTL